MPIQWVVIVLPRRPSFVLLVLTFQEASLCWCSGKLNKGLVTGFSCHGKSIIVPTFEREITWKSLFIWDRKVFADFNNVLSDLQCCYISCRLETDEPDTIKLYATVFDCHTLYIQWLAEQLSDCRCFMLIRFHIKKASHESKQGWRYSGMPSSKSFEDPLCSNCELIFAYFCWWLETLALIQDEIWQVLIMMRKWWTCHGPFPY